MFNLRSQNPELLISTLTGKFYQVTCLVTLGELGKAFWVLYVHLKFLLLVMAA